MGVLKFKRGIASAKPTLEQSELYFATDTKRLYVGLPSGTDMQIGDINDIVMKSLGTTKGDLIVFSGSGTPIRLAVGVTNGHVLTVDGAETAGMKWAAAAAGGGVAGMSFFIPGNAYVANNIQYARIPKAFTLSKVQIAVDSAPTGANLIVDVHYHATDPTSLTTVFTTTGNRPEIAASGTTDDSGTPDVTSLAAGGIVGICIDQVGSTLPGSNLMVTLVAS